MFLYLYKITDITTNEFYIGSRVSKQIPELDQYMGSMKTWKPDIKNLKKEIIRSDFKNHKDLIEAESKLIRENIENPLNRNYHIPNLGFSTYGKKHTSESKQKMSDKAKKGPLSEDHKIKISESNKGKNHTEETKKILSNKIKGRKLSDDWKLKISDSLKGRSIPDDVKVKISESSKGKEISEEWRLKISESLKGRNLSEETKNKISKKQSGKIISEETKQKMSIAKQGIKKEKIKCPYCEKEGGKPVMNRFHFENCKHKIDMK